MGKMVDAYYISMLLRDREQGRLTTLFAMQVLHHLHWLRSFD
jgi:hypothetical protein